MRGIFGAGRSWESGLMQLFKDSFFWSLILATHMAAILLAWELVYRVRSLRKGSDGS